MWYQKISQHHSPQQCTYLTDYAWQCGCINLKNGTQACLGVMYQECKQTPFPKKPLQLSGAATVACNSVHGPETPKQSPIGRMLSSGKRYAKNLNPFRRSTQDGSSAMEVCHHVNVLNIVRMCGKQYHRAHIVADVAYTPHKHSIPDVLDMINDQYLWYIRVSTQRQVLPVVHACKVTWAIQFSI